MGVDKSRWLRRPTMALGHAFDSESAYGRYLRLEIKPSDRQSEIVGDCSMTLGSKWASVCCPNYFMGMRRGRVSTGRSPAVYFDQFIGRCGKFFIGQLKPFRPRVILSLRVYVPGLFASRSESLEEWLSARSFSEIDRIGSLHFNLGSMSDRGGIHVVSMTHPCFHGPKMHHRRSRRTQGSMAEIAMLKETMK